MADDDTLEILIKTRGGKLASAEIRDVGKAAEESGRKAKKAGSAWSAAGGKMRRAGRTMTTGLSVPIVAVGAAAGVAAVKWESAFAGVRKTVNATEPQLASLASGIRAMSREIPVSAVELAGIAEAAGQLGIKTPNIEGFTRVMADLGVATNLSGEQAATQLARLANITGMSQGDFDRLGSTIVALGNNLATTEAEISELGLRLAGAGNQIGMTEAEILGMAGAISSVGINAEAGGTAFSQSMLLMNSAVAGGGKDLAGFAKVAGVSADTFAKRWKKDASGAFITFIEGLGRVKKEGGDVSGALKDLGLGGIRVQDALMRASGAGDLFRDSLALGTKSWKENSALTKEAEQRYKTTESQLKILKNYITDLGVTVGSEFLPVVVDMAKKLMPAVKDVTEAFGKLSPEAKIAIVAFLGLVAIAGPLLIAIGMMATGVGALAGAFSFLAANPAVLIIAALVALGIGLVVLYKKSETFRNIVTGAINVVWQVFKRTPVGFVIANFTRMVDFIKGLPGKIAGAARGMWDGIKSAFRGAINWIIRGWNSLEFKVPGIDLPGPLGKVGGFTVGVPDIPELGDGGDIARRGAAIVGDKGPELLDLPEGARVTPLDGRGGPVREVVRLVTVDGRVLAEAVFGAGADARARA